MPEATEIPDAVETVPGRLIVLLGPSGSGKDTLISGARSEFAASSDVLFVQRVITRSADAGSEDHIAMSEAEFDAAIDDGRFALTWAANGLRYGLPRGIKAHLAAGKVAVVNGSRGAWGVIRQVFPSAVAVEIKVDPGTLAQRLQARGRESAAEIEARLIRAAALAAQFEPELVIDNSGPVETARSALINYIRQSVARQVG
ncbi:MAG: phosphonate metabolism protein/1,5-bisphosphokinase (PRPP-forming) PhnN [Hoeflea sp.]|uniref:phosphonate metabolism protein/1,5-bisphosphokinase (PRPP-forming) PhnN n=1 Tax=Hoeflea sp. TaxID=1940281 RepID=UPI001E0B38D4|nr:phosphonate metabolism protein/1,5-bisphosphokinase (PRPP-forming) PhnN [Hoeflea sp.]MBU4528771.1 phosphonate metabolism protein/1,5-bisphosphokinase (PRPP-forming) PhnN [Alphaproteobacteria bacterium]MBU4545902.1 phosphonate metabolism protein/1,5-bisphosphokinase (PRPP-forming) PhnN [Alphaproteobacteria bacterium]MBU4549905.1 phosphonate metabolism protein/1,5-bisphosphokinase (PRPP-forming) PhnN [Alphaproteobacteria bacterium]MBV1725902.1 phosphonate metabolism protein/1,5-bisphosphokinas